jgi:hypothetical protein
LEALRLHLEGMPRPLTLEGLRAVVSGYKTQLAVADMEQLQELTLFVLTSDEETPRLSDLGVYFGLALVGPGLQRVTVHSWVSWRSNQVTEEATDFLRNTLIPGAMIDFGEIPGSVLEDLDSE